MKRTMIFSMAILALLLLIFPFQLIAGSSGDDSSTGRVCFENNSWQEKLISQLEQNLKSTRHELENLKGEIEEMEQDFQSYCPRSFPVFDGIVYKNKIIFNSTLSNFSDTLHFYGVPESFLNGLAEYSVERPVYLDKWEFNCNRQDDCIWNIAEYLHWVQNQIREIEADCSVDKSKIVARVVNNGKQLFNKILFSYEILVKKSKIDNFPKFDPFLIPEDFEVDATPDIR